MQLNIIIPTILASIRNINPTASYFGN